jgi:hypothetical protein
VLKVISISPGELEPVFQAMLENAVRICDAKFGTLQLRDNGAFRVAAMHNPPPLFAEARQRNPLIYPSAHNVLGRVIATQQLAHIADYRQELAYKERDPAAVSIVELGGARTVVLVPMIKEGELIGNILLYRQEGAADCDPCGWISSARVPGRVGAFCGGVSGRFETYRICPRREPDSGVSLGGRPIRTIS